MPSPDAVGLSDPRLDQPVDDANYRPDLTLGYFEPEDISLLAGDAFTGKTRFILCELDRYLDTGTFLYRHDGADPKPSVCIIAKPHQTRQIKKLIRQLDLDSISPSWCFDHGSARQGASAIREAVEKFINKFKSPPSILIIDTPIQDFAPEPKFGDSAPIESFYAELRELCSEMHITIIAMAKTSKRKIKDSYVRSIQVVKGSATWAEVIVILLLDYPRHIRNEAVPYREITVASHGEATQYIPLEFHRDGRIAIQIESGGWRERLLAKVLELPDGFVVRTKELKEWGIVMGVSGRSIERWIYEMRGSLLDPCEAQGAYKKIPQFHA